jgi:hypothetical protein
MRVKREEPMCEDLSLHYWSWNPLKFSEASACKFAKMLARVEKISFYGNGYKFFPTSVHWELLAKEVVKLKECNILSLHTLDTSEMYWGSHGGIPPTIKHEIDSINRCIAS